MPTYPNRCQHIKVNGTQCGSPALRRNRFCYFHKRHHDERIQINGDRQKNTRSRRRAVAIDLPVFEDANSIQVSLMQITRLLIAGDIDAKTAGLILYALQTASSNLCRASFEPDVHDVILDPSSIRETALGAHIWDDSDFIDEDEIDDETDDGIDPARRAGVMKAAEFLYELDRKNAGIHGFAPKPAPAPPKSDSGTKSDSRSESKTDPKLDPKTKKSPARDISAAQVRQQIREQVVNAAPALLAANPTLFPRPPAEREASHPERSTLGGRQTGPDQSHPTDVDVTSNSPP